MKYVVTSISKNKYIEYFERDDSGTFIMKAWATSVPMYKVRLESMGEPKIWAIFTTNDAGVWRASDGNKYNLSAKPWTYIEKDETFLGPYKYIREMNALLDKCNKEKLKKLDVIGE